MSWTTTPTTLAELEGALDEAELSLCIHRGAGPERYVAHLYAPDDPISVVVGDGPDLPSAVSDALKQWQDGDSRPPDMDDAPGGPTECGHPPLPCPVAEDGCTCRCVTCVAARSKRKRSN